MSTPAVIFAIYFGLGLLSMVVAVASSGKEKRTKGFESFSYGGGDAFDAGILVLIALLWPIWLLGIILKKERKE